MHSSTLTRLRDSLNGLGLEKLQEKLTASATEAVDMASKLWDEWESKDAKTVVDSLRLKADEVLADPQIKSVFEQGVERLNILLCKAFDGTWVGLEDSQPRCVIKETTITWHWGADSELEIWGSNSISTDLEGDTFKATLTPRGELAWSDGDIWVRLVPPGAESCKSENEKKETGNSDAAAPNLGLLQKSLADLKKVVGGEKLEGDVEEAVAAAQSALTNIAESDGEVKQLVSQMRRRQETLQEIQGELLQSRAGQVLQEGHTRIRQQFQKLQDTSITPELEKMQFRGQRFFTRLTTDKRVKHKAVEFFTGTQSRIMQRLSSSGNSIEDWVAKVKEHVLGQFSVHWAMLVESLGGLNLQDLDLRQLVANSWRPVDLEAQIARSMVKGMKLSGLDKSGTELLEQFENSDTVAQIPVLQQTYKSILSVLDDLNIEMPEAIRKLLEAQAAGHAGDISSWKSAVINSLDDENVVKGASDFVKHSEKLLTQFQELKSSKTVAKVMEHLENEDIERDLLKKLHDLDTEAMLNNAEGALTNAEVRDALVGQFKDICLEFILRILPAINIEKLSGNDNGCDWELNDINFSDFHFRKEDVNITLGNPLVPGENLLTLHAWDISAHFRKIKVSVQNSAFPNIRAQCTADAKAERMSVLLAFALARGPSGKPQLVMNGRYVQMESLDLSITDSSYTLLVNALSFLFADLLKGYASRKIAKHLDEHVGTLINVLNNVIITCYPVLEKLGWSLPALEPQMSAVELPEHTQRVWWLGEGDELLEAPPVPVEPHASPTLQAQPAPPVQPDLAAPRGSAASPPAASAATAAAVALVGPRPRQLGRDGLTFTPQVRRTRRDLFEELDWAEQACHSAPRRIHLSRREQWGQRRKSVPVPSSTLVST